MATTKNEYQFEISMMIEGTGSRRRLPVSRVLGGGWSGGAGAASARGCGASTDSGESQRFIIRRLDKAKSLKSARRSRQARAQPAGRLTSFLVIVSEC